MTKYTKVLLGAVSFAALATVAHAADPVVVVDVPAGYNWSGLYIGAGIGVGAVVHDVSVNNLGGVTGFIDSVSLNGIGGEGVFGELTIGYDYMVSPRFLIGAFADAHFGNIGPELDGGDLINANLENKYGFDVGGRVGYLFNPTTLGYALAGYTWQRFELDGSLFGGAVPFDFEEDRDGYVVGVGMETVLGGAWTLKTEYRYANYGDETVFTFEDEDGDVDIDVEPSVHTFLLGVNYKFGADNGGGAPIETPAYSWTGFYVGVAGAAGAAVTELSIDGGSLDGIGGEGVRGEINAGYDYDFGNFVAGIMVDAHYGNGKSELELDFGLGSLNFDAKADYGFDILARAGMKVNESTLAYVLGGYSWQNFEVEASATGAGSEDIAEWDVDGFSIGGGLETAVTANMTVGFEYRYTQFEDADLDLDGLDVETSMQTARITAKYKFN
ncbi:outer membrane beta-barrel protein [Mesorhizobium sp. KR9-304]|uniref:outer membrane protein n=1 Tax=Mesorhizobium sp. KR9-304 TaxID=3156614 RepID=UPI0032B5D043